MTNIHRRRPQAQKQLQFDNPQPEAQSSTENTPGIGHNSASNGVGNWIALSRDVANHPIVGFGKPVKPADTKRGSYSRAEAWLDLIMEANWFRRRECNKGKIVYIERGQLIASRGFLATRWNWTEKTVRGFLELLECDAMIVRNEGQSEGRNKGHFANVITICKYDIYQTAKEIAGLLGDQDEGRSRASQGPVKGQTLNKETKEQVREEDSGPSDSGADAPADEVLEETAQQVVWGKGLDWLRKNSFVGSEERLRIRVGRWVKEYGPEAVLGAMRAAQKAKPGEVMSYIEKILAADDRANQHVRWDAGRIQVMNGFEAELSSLLGGRDLRRALDRVGGKIAVGISGVALETRVRSEIITLADQVADQDRRYERAAQGNLKTKASAANDSIYDGVL